MLARLVNELPTIVVLALTVLGVSESEASGFVELLVSLASSSVWLHVRRQLEGPVTYHRSNQMMQAFRSGNLTVNGGK